VKKNLSLRFIAFNTRSLLYVERQTEKRSSSSIFLLSYEDTKVNGDKEINIYIEIKRFKLR